MHTRRRLLATLAGGLALLPAAPAAAQNPLRCNAKGSTTIAFAGSIRVFTVQRRGRLDQRDWHACRTPRGRATLIHDGARNETARAPQIVAGRYVGIIAERIAPIDGGRDRIVRVLDLTTRRFTVRRRDVDRSPPAEVRPRSDEFAVLHDGSAAFVETGDPESSLLLARPRTTQLTTLDATAQGDETVQITDLAASPRTLYWRNGSTTKSFDYRTG